MITVSKRKNGNIGINIDCDHTKDVKAYVTEFISKADNRGIDIIYKDYRQYDKLPKVTQASRVRDFALKTRELEGNLNVWDEVYKLLSNKLKITRDFILKLEKTSDYEIPDKTRYVTIIKLGYGAQLLESIDEVKKQS